MEGNPDVPENSKETDNLVPMEGEGGDELTTEITTLLSEMPGHSGPTPRSDESVDSSRPSETSRSHPHPYHLKNKYTFRSDSVYSDVVPISAASNHQSNKTSEPREKSGSLSSLKAKEKESKWATLKKKIGRLNSSSSAVTSNPTSDKGSKTEVKENKEVENKRDKPSSKSLNEKRSIFQRAKTLSILPVNRSSKDKDETYQPQPKRVAEPPELFNVGGEMNLIPLELLIDVNTCSGGMKRK